MRLDELSDEQLDRQLRKLVPAAPSSRSWQRTQREQLIRRITASDPATPEHHDHSGSEIPEVLVELAAHSTEQPVSRRWPALVAAVAAVVVVGGLVIAERSPDAPGSTQGSPTSPATTSELSEVPVPLLPAGPTEPDRFGVVTDGWTVAGPVTGAWGMWLGWETPAAEALVARPDGDMLRDGITLTVSSTYAPDHYMGTPRRETVAGLDVEVYTEPGTPVLTTVVVPGSPALAVSGVDPIGFLEAAGGFPVEGASTGDDGVSFAVGGLPDDYELIVPPTQRATSHIDAWTRAVDGDGGDGVAVLVNVRDPLLVLAQVGDLQRIDINGASGWRTSDDEAPTVFWQVNDITYAAVVGASNIDDATTFARAIDFVDQATWTERYDVATRPDPPDTDDTTAASTTPAPAETTQGDAPETVEYIVQDSDDPLKLAEQFCMTVDELVSVNNWTGVIELPLPGTAVLVYDRTCPDTSLDVNSQHEPGVLLFDDPPPQLDGLQNVLLAGGRSPWVTPSVWEGAWTTRVYSSNPTRPEEGPTLIVSTTDGLPDDPMVGDQPVSIGTATGWETTDRATGQPALIFSRDGRGFRITGTAVGNEELQRAGAATIVDANGFPVITPDGLPDGLIEIASGVSELHPYQLVDLDTQRYTSPTIVWSDSTGNDDRYLAITSIREEPEALTTHRTGFSTVTDVETRLVPGFLTTVASDPTFIGLTWHEQGRTYLLVSYGFDAAMITQIANDLRPASPSEYDELVRQSDELEQ